MTVTVLHELQLSFLKEQFLKKNKSDLFHKIRIKAWELFLEKGLPEKKDDAFRYLPLSSFYTLSFEEPSLEGAISKEDLQGKILKECTHSCLVFVNGELSLELSDISALPKGVVILPLESAFTTYGSFLNNRLLKAIQEENDPFALLNVALMQKGCFLYVPPKMLVDTPVQLLHVTVSDKGNCFYNGRTHVFLGAHAEMKVIETHFSKQGSFWGVNGVDVALEEGSIFQYNNLVDISESSWFFESFRASQKRDSILRALAFTSGSKTVRFDQKVELNGENSEVHTEGLWMLDASKQAHTYITIKHNAPHTRSNQFFKGMVDDYSQSSFEGKIYVKDVAQKTEAYQLNQNLILGERAIANSKPNLEIFADDVKASHGATISQINPEEMFYLRSRGLSAEEARALLVMGFGAEILEKIFVEEAKERMLSFSQSYLRKDK